MMRLLLDENVSPALVPDLWTAGADTEHVRDRGMLGATDPVIWRYGLLHERAIVTINGRDFRKFAGQAYSHPGVILIPSGGNRQEQLGYVGAAIEHAKAQDAIRPSFTKQIIEVDETRTVRAEVVCAAAVEPDQAPDKIVALSQKKPA